MARYIKLSSTQKDEIRRLVQLANRRIKAADRAYRKAGQEILPSDVAGRHQVRERWATKNTPISRSVRFESYEDYQRQLQYLRSFEVSRPGIREYTEVQRDKTLQAVETSLGQEAPTDLQERLSKMSAPELSEFWNRFSDKASKLGMNYSSEAAMQQTLNELYPEDINRVAG